MSTWPVTARPTRQVRPTMVPFLLRMALMRCNVPCTPALLSLPKSPTAFSAALKSSQVICTPHCMQHHTQQATCHCWYVGWGVRGRVQGCSQHLSLTEVLPTADSKESGFWPSAQVENNLGGGVHGNNEV